MKRKVASEKQTLDQVTRGVVVRNSQRKNKQSNF